MFAIIEVGGKQYRVAPNNKIKVEKLSELGETNKEIVLDKVLFLKKSDGSFEIGKPLVANVEVKAELLETYKDDKVIDFVKRRRKNSMRKNGHRQVQSDLKIVSINVK
jgi:large subunit ribosomal protein L21